jgi:hypothetical protein
MLWYKGWLETRFRLLFVLAIVAFLLTIHQAFKAPVSTVHAKSTLLGMIMFADAIPLVLICGMLGGAGIATQPSLQASKGIHGSSLFTLSMPVSRLRLLSTRAAIGWLECVVTIALLCIGTWFRSPVLKNVATPFEMVEYATTLITCGSALYFFSVLLGTFLDDQWRTWGTMFGAGALWWLFHYAPLPASIDIIRAVSSGSPLLVHTMPWSAMAFSVTLAAVFFVTALKVVQTREY